ncbi:MAG: hypothetical protein H6718_14315 [Polyangiaceae bacterium]|nr:hypothetical protein [Polyangiaceae bacterium]MCB9606078.1 hypothetical protein [Polyangiaceae bacterium]
MRMLRLALLTSGLGLLGLASACTAEFTSAEETGGAGGMAGSAGTGGIAGSGGVAGAAGTGGAAGSAGAASAGGTGGSCNGAASPSDDSCVVTEDYGVFVSPKGDDTTGDGSRSAPYATLEAALIAAYSSGKRVYACSSEGEFVPNGNLLAIDDSLSGSQLYGGLDCDTWAYDVSKPTEVVGNYAALYVNGVKGGLRIEDFSFRAVDQTLNSSIGALVRDSDGVLFKRVKFIAGKGADGDDGTDGSVGDPGTAVADSQKGEDGTCSSPGVRRGGRWSGPSSCGSTGGPGGDADFDFGPENGIAGLPSGNANGGLAGTLSSVNGVTGTDGAKGSDGNVGSVAEAVGLFHQDGYDPANGNPGTNGVVGQGGGGGGGAFKNAASTCGGAGGGAGGMGGCGGGLGAAGGGGHSSVALLVWESGVTVTDCAFESGEGGAGGRGGNGGNGGPGGDGASGGAAAGGSGKGGRGGVGGDGGGGGSGSGGSGGPSYGLVYKGMKPAETNSCSFSVGSGGIGGHGGTQDGVNLNPAPDGPAGSTAEIYEQL